MVMFFITGLILSGSKVMSHTVQFLYLSSWSLSQGSEGLFNRDQCLVLMESC